MTRDAVVVVFIVLAITIVSAVVPAIVENNVQQESIRLETAGKKAQFDVLEKMFSEFPLNPRNFEKEYVKNCMKQQLEENKDRSEADAQAYCSCIAPVAQEPFTGNYHNTPEWWAAYVEKMHACGPR